MLGVRVLRAESALFALSSLTMSSLTPCKACLFMIALKANLHMAPCGPVKCLRTKTGKICTRSVRVVVITANWQLALFFSEQVCLITQVFILCSTVWESWEVVFTQESWHKCTWLSYTSFLSEKAAKPCWNNTVEFINMKQETCIASGFSQRPWTCGILSIYQW